MSQKGNSFARYMVELRKGVGLSIEEAARNIGVGIDVLKSWEDGKSYPSELSAQSIAMVYKIPQSEWLEVLKAELMGRFGPKP
jgi:DNA-binding transcriptional regulator YiaG